MLKKFEGVITAQTAQTFTVRFFEGDLATFEAEFALDKLSPSDQKLAEEGAQVVWTTGSQECLCIRQLLPLTDVEVEENSQAAKVLMSGIKWE